MSSTTRDIDQLSEIKELPEGWRWVRLGEVCNKHTGIRDPRIEPDTIFQYVDISSVCNSKKCITVAKSILGKDAPSRARQIIRFNDVIVATTRPNLNAVAQVPKELDNQICSTGFCVLRAGESILPEYLFAFVCYELFVDALSDFVKGALYPAVNDGQVLAQHIPLPPLPEQQRIAAILKEQMAAVDKARTGAQERLRAIKALPAAFLRQILPDPGQPLPDGWRWAKLGEACVPDRKIVEPNTSHAKSLNYYSLEHIESETGRILKIPNDQPEDEGKSMTFQFDQRHVLYGKLRPYLNKVALPFSSGRCTTEMIPLLPCEGIDRIFLAWLLRRQETVEFAMQGKTGSRMPRADMDSLLMLKIPLSTFPQQKRIVALISEQIAAVEKARIAAEAELKAINTLPAALLRRAFNGEL